MHYKNRKSHTNQSEKDRAVAHQTRALIWSDRKHLTSWEDILQTPLTVTWVLRSMNDLSTSKAAMCFSSGDIERDFSIDSQGQILITPPSEPDQRSPRRRNSKLANKWWESILLEARNWSFFILELILTLEFIVQLTLTRMYRNINCIIFDSL